MYWQWPSSAVLGPREGNDIMDRMVRKMKTTTKLMSLLLVAIMAVGTYPGLFLVGSADLEPNDTFLTAEVLAPTTPVTGALNVTDNADYYKFNVIAAQVISVKLAVMTGSGNDVWGGLYYPDQSKIVETDYINAGTFAWINFTTSSATTGFYYYEVQAQGAIDTYTVTLTVTNQNDAGLGIDAGDTTTAATPITNGTYTGRVFDDDAADVYKVMVVAAQILTVDLKTGTTNNDHLYAKFYDPQKNSIDSTDWANPGINVTWEFTTSIATAGWYYVEVLGGYNDYQLKVKVNPQNDSGLGIDASDSLTAPTMITPGTLFTGWLADDDAKDVYGFNVVNAQKISVFFRTGTKRTTALYAELFGPDKVKIMDTDSLQPDIGQTITYTTSSATAGIYYVVIPVNDNSYQVRVTVTNQNDANKGKDAPDDFPGMPVTVGKDYPGWIFDADQKDYYNVNLTMGQTITVNLTVGTTITTNTQYVELYDPAKEKLTYSDNINSGSTGGTTYTTSYETAGMYYFLVKGSDNDYKFSVDIKNQSDANSGMDAPAAFEKAINLKTGSYTGYLADADKQDMYNISVKANHGFTVNFTAGAGGTNTMNMEIYDMSKSKITTLTSAPDVKTTFTLAAANVPLVNSVYYLLVKDGDKKNYNVQVYLPELPPDNIAPVVVIATPINNAAFKIANTTVTGTATDANSIVSKVQWSLDNATWKDCTGTGAWVCDVTMVVGANKVTIKATDPSGNKGYKDLTVNFDGTAPTLTVTSSVNGTKVSKSKVTITGTASDNVALLRVEYSVNGGAWFVTTGTGQWSADVPLKQGKNTIVVRATDTAGNTVEKTINVEYKKASPGFIPGFESVLLIGAVMVGTLALSRKLRK